MGRVDKGMKCQVFSCSGDAVRSISADKVKLAGMKISSQKRAYLCKEHYKEYKKKTKKDKRLEKLRYKG